MRMKEMTRSYVDHDGHEEEIEYDEHIWTSPVNAMKLVDVIGDTLAEADPAHADTYHQGAENYKKELEEIDSGFREVSANRKRNMIVMGINSRSVIWQMSINWTTGQPFPAAALTQSQARRPLPI